MKKNLFLVCLCFILNIGLYGQETNIVPGSIIVLLNADADVETLASELAYLNGVETRLQVARVLSQRMNIYLLEFDEQSVNQNELLRVVKMNNLVKIAQFNHVFEERNTPDDTEFADLWAMNNTGQSGGTNDADIDATEAWDITTGGLTAAGDTIVVAVVDGGFYLPHVDLDFWKNRFEIPNNGIDDDGNGYVDDYKGWNGSTGNDNLPSLSHGTHVSGIVGAKGNNATGVTGVNWNVKIMAVSYGSGGGSTLEANAVAGYAFIIEQRRTYNQTNGAMGAFVVSTNSSFGINNGQPSSYPLWCAMYDSLGAVGILSAAATANANLNVDTQGDIPTACTSDWLVTVTNTTDTDGKYNSAAYGATTIDLGAPGTDINSTYPSNSYSSSTGTSMATPHVAGAIALMYSAPCADFITDYKTDPAGVALKVKDSLLNSVDAVSALNGITVTGGRLNLHKAVQSIQHYCSSTSVNTVEGHVSNLAITNVFPNPADETITVSYILSAEAVSATLSITNVLGQQMKHYSLANRSNGKLQYKLDINDLESGIYFVHIKTNNESSNTLRFVVR